MLEKFTPGPWEVDTTPVQFEENRKSYPFIGVRAKDTAWVAELPAESHAIDYDESLANATLIAAAPKMYKALSDMVLNFGNHEARLFNALDALESANPEIKNIYKALSDASFKNTEP